MPAPPAPRPILRLSSFVSSLRALPLRALLPLPFGAAILWLLAGRLSALDWEAVAVQIWTTPAQAWLGALALTALSFWAVARYDGVGHRMMGTPIAPGKSIRVGAAATALSQTLGVGLLTGSLVRWRLLRREGLGATGGLMLTGLVSAGFFMGWALFTFGVLALSPPLAGAPPEWQARVQILVIAAVGLVLGLSLRNRPVRLFKRRISPPSPALLLRVTVLAGIDTAAAAGALWLLLPPEAMLSFGLLLPAFLIALGCGIFAGTPMGLGAFELTLLLLLPTTPEAALVGGILAFRLVYYVAPALIAAAYILWPRARPAPCPTLDTRTASDPLAGLLHQGDRGVLRGALGHWQVSDSPFGRVTLGDPVSTEATSRAALALSRGQMLAHYKLTAPLAQTLASKGFWTLPVASEAIINVAAFDPTTPAHRQLRRKLRNADKAGITVTQGPLPHGQMARIARDWAQAHGGQRGFSVGRFDLPLIARQEVFLAWHKGQLVGFVTFHVGRDGWLLDLVRHGPDLPDGTIHRLILTACEAALAAGVARLSLDCLPYVFAPGTPGVFARHIAPRALARCPRARGLAQFKQSFAPELHLRYFAARGPLRFALGALATAWLLSRRYPETTASEPHDLHVDYAFASCSSTWHPQENRTRSAPDV